jgi:predicted phage-related endonuclease
VRYPWALASLDGIADGNRVVEVKTARTAEGWGEPGTAEIPEVYTLQVQHYLAVTELHVADVPVLIGGSDFRIYELTEDLELQTLLMEGERIFWQRVLEGNPPDPINPDDVRRRWPKSSYGVGRMASSGIIAKCRELRDIGEKIKTLESLADLLKSEIQSDMAEAEVLQTTDDVVLATWKSAKAAERFDAKAFSKDHPDLARQYITEGKPQRRFLLKGTTDGD